MAKAETRPARRPRKLTVADLLRRAETERRLRAHFYEDTLKTIRAAVGVDTMRMVVELMLREKGLIK
jgi:hypothetical protein